jgi:hypothetical protein
MDMSDIKVKWFCPILIGAFCLLISGYQVNSEETGKSRKLMDANGDYLLITHDDTPDRPDFQKVEIFRNNKGLRDQIKIHGPIKEMNAISRTKTETIEELIEDISLWIPKLYGDQFSINPRCIIILETKINEDDKAEVRFAVAMECLPKLRSNKTIQI